MSRWFHAEIPGLTVRAELACVIIVALLMTGCAEVTRHIPSSWGLGLTILEKPKPLPQPPAPPRQTVAQPKPIVLSPSPRQPTRIIPPAPLPKVSAAKLPAPSAAPQDTTLRTGDLASKPNSPQSITREKLATCYDVAIEAHQNYQIYLNTESPELVVNLGYLRAAHFGYSRATHLCAATTYKKYAVFRRGLLSFLLGEYGDALSALNTYGDLNPGDGGVDSILSLLRAWHDDPIRCRDIGADLIGIRRAMTLGYRGYTGGALKKYREMRRHIEPNADCPQVIWFLNRKIVELEGLPTS